MGLLEIGVAAIAILLFLILQALWKLLRIIEIELQVGLGRRLHYAVDGMITLVGSDGVGANVGGTGYMYDLIKQLESVEYRLDQIEVNTSHLIKPNSRGSDFPWESK